LLEVRPDYANLKINDKIRTVKPAEVKPGDIIIVKPGERIPLDGIVIEGHSFADTFSLTGETVPKDLSENDPVLAGMINKSGLLKIRVTKYFGESSISKILKLVENASSKKAAAENFISTFARYYTPVVVGLAVLVGFLPPLIFPQQNLSDWVYRALVMLVISCPCALVISIPLGYFAGIGAASGKGILIKGSNYLDALNHVKTVVFDKTGTLTKGIFQVTSIVNKNGFGKEEILFYAALAECHSNHPAAEAIVSSFSGIIDPSLVSHVEEVPGQGIKAEVKGNYVLAGNHRLLKENNIFIEESSSDGAVIHIAVNSRYAGYIVISDEIREDSVSTIAELQKEGVEHVIMLTGDNEFSAGKTAAETGIREVYWGLLPEDKVDLLEKIRNLYGREGKVAFAGDGINDAPVIMYADVGIAMGGLGSDAAVEAADIVLMKDKPSLIPEALRIAKRTRRIVWENIIIAVVIKAVFITMGGWGLAGMWEAVFADMGVALFAILNGVRIMKS
jgi:Cd2+/Zn2+-exporting ATPase